MFVGICFTLTALWAWRYRDSHLREWPSLHPASSVHVWDMHRIVYSGTGDYGQTDSLQGIKNFQVIAFDHWSGLIKIGTMNTKTLVVLPVYDYCTLQEPGIVSIFDSLQEICTLAARKTLWVSTLYWHQTYTLLVGCNGKRHNATGWSGCVFKTLP